MVGKRYQHRARPCTPQRRHRLAKIHSATLQRYFRIKQSAQNGWQGRLLLQIHLINMESTVTHIRTNQLAGKVPLQIHLTKMESQVTQIRTTQMAMAVPSQTYIANMEGKVTHFRSQHMAGRVLLSH